MLRAQGKAKCEYKSFLQLGKFTFLCTFSIVTYLEDLFHAQKQFFRKQVASDHVTFWNVFRLSFFSIKKLPAPHQNASLLPAVLRNCLATIA